MAPVSPIQTTRLQNGGNDSELKSPRLDPNVLDVFLGNLHIKPWFASFYPEELVGPRTEKLFVCPHCFKYVREVMPFLGHTAICANDPSNPPGRLIYEKAPFTIYEVDGEEHKLYTQNLSLFAKLFLETKSVFYDVTTFLYYVLVYADPTQKQATPQVVGFFSKEKMSWDNNNLACILVFPPWQKKGFGQILMGASYELSKREGRLGGPEKPLSELGRKGYISFWSATIARLLLSQPVKKTLTVREIRDETYILPEDIMTTLKEMKVLDRRKKGQASLAINKAELRVWAEKMRVSMVPPIDPGAFILEDEEEAVEEDEEMEVDD
ncbi:hypothetical protein P152DRAFT_460192 [Eremomyces bilateralis CBS 781.70]|uniref:histone acetyltransferase n=1 Tax=Eremomyces bilateralis CBS 781.70 TaxID=1392243 RepID=A0A6G1FYX6_9PEZI|nr:uncharacterized protein P152DRAFT_460192 [Eremomyces bilateralis CBS 781.70]KAF1810901.1 hypothetical protein P152DRAFT_460192 [Eremomyces bilateralis CBS 781.70]